MLPIPLRLLKNKTDLTVFLRAKIKKAIEYLSRKHKCNWVHSRHAVHAIDIAIILSSCYLTAPYYGAPLFLDCCGLIRQVLLDLKEDFGFVIGGGNQAYMVWDYIIDITS